MLIYCPQAAADSGRVHARIILTGPSLPSRATSQLFFSLYDDRSRKRQCGGRMVRLADLPSDSLLTAAKESAKSEGRAPAIWPYCTAQKPSVEL
jgi:hypothetical protein